jgi:hypothetical protein
MDEEVNASYGGTNTERNICCGGEPVGLSAFVVLIIIHASHQRQFVELNKATWLHYHKEMHAFYSK